MRQHWRPKRRWIHAYWFFGSPFEPGEQLAIGRRETRPQEFNVMGIFVAERGTGGFSKPRRNADAQAAGDKLDQRPAPGFVERIEPACELPRELRFAQRG